MNDYSPFSVPIEQLETTHLHILTSVVEGWYVEYKREVPNARSVAKSLSAFANAYGGWLFIGIEQVSHGTAVAGQFLGVADDDVEGALQRIRQSVAANVTPPPYFEVRVLSGPDNAIALPSGRSIIVVHVPWSPNAPHVHSSGQVFRRVADGSEPAPEGDRFVLDQLWRRGDPTRSKVRKWVTRGLQLSNEEKKQPHLKLLFTADPWLQKGLRLDLSAEELSKLVNNADAKNRLPFDVQHSYESGYLFRQVMTNDPMQRGIALRISHMCNLEFTCPLPTLKTGDEAVLAQWLSGYSVAERFQTALTSRGYNFFRVVDMNFLVAILLYITELYVRLLELVSSDTEFYVKSVFKGVWRTIPFFDVPQIVANFESSGVPMPLTKTVTIPPGTDPDSFCRMRPAEDDETDTLIRALAIFELVAEAVGVPTLNSLPDGHGTAGSFVEALLRCRETATQVQQRRNRVQG